MPITEREKELRTIVDGIRDNPDGTALARLIVNGIEQARFEGLGNWDQARYVAHFALQAGWQPPAAIPGAEPRPLAVGDRVLVTLPPHDPCGEDSGKYGQISHIDDEGGYIVSIDGKTSGDIGLRTVAPELTLQPATDDATAEAGARANA